MRAILSVLATLAWLGAFGAVAGAALLNPTLMGLSGIASAVSALVWGVVCAVMRGRRDGDDGPDVRYTPVDHGRIAS